MSNFDFSRIDAAQNRGGVQHQPVLTYEHRTADEKTRNLAYTVAPQIRDNLINQGINNPRVHISAQTDWGTGNDSRLVITASADGQSIIGSDKVDTNSIRNALIDALPVGASVTIGNGNIIAVWPK